MKFMDYKCLESLLIEGEDLIATEGIGSNIKSFFKSIGNTIISIIHKFIGLIGKIITFIKNKGKTIHTDKETYLKAYRLSSEAYPILLDVIRNTYNSVEMLSFSVFSINKHGSEFHDENIEHAEMTYLKVVNKFTGLKSFVGNEKLYFYKDSRDHIMKVLNDSKDRFEKAEDKVRNMIGDEMAKDVSTDNYDAQMKRANDYLNYLTKYSALFGEVTNFVNSHVSNDIITVKDAIKHIT